ncbi:arginine N-succinyltransferase [Oceanicoccus sp. KOV_DT_Chl]|uniref:arginine N-succinyltransferase n=1 Tax=Oceanicoccus sp. KOV_DT_Chl TaxID=1904639 RepID=UPI000C7D99F3|nr:arginine N-succinyltransferase [Oceanicoccus sp. KOV_DT_Chl]
MLIIRPVANGDLADLLQLANKAGKGMTSLPPCEQTLQQSIDKSTASFNSSKPSPEDYFLLVLEDLSIGKVVGTTAIYARTHSKQAFYAYRLMSAIHYSHSLGKEVRSGVLQLANDYTDCSEVGTLFVDPDYRGNGHWLASSRYLFMGIFRERFHSHVVAELRGWLDEQGNSPFWEAIGQHFFEMSFEQADRLCSAGSNQFITELMPKFPIYTRMLPEQARAVLGKPHDAGRRALELLINEGFEYEDFIDIFDAGPMLRAKIDSLRSVKAIERGTAIATDKPLDASPSIVVNGKLSDLRFIKTPITRGDEGEIKMSAAAIAALKVAPGELIHLIGKSRES